MALKGLEHFVLACVPVCGPRGPTHVGPYVWPRTGAHGRAHVCFAHMCDNYVLFAKEKAYGLRYQTAPIVSGERCLGQRPRQIEPETICAVVGSETLAAFHVSECRLAEGQFDTLRS